jgi:hypothetical protein
MSTAMQPTEPTPAPADPALIAAWRRFLDYNRIAISQKHEHNRIRSWVIALSLLTSAGAVVATFIPQFSASFTVFAAALVVANVLVFALMIYMWRPGYRQLALWIAFMVIVTLAVFVLTPAGLLGGLFRAMLIVLPIISVGLMNFASQFTSSTAWIEYRHAAETLRSEIILYRANAGRYFAMADSFERQTALLAVVSETDRHIGQVNESVTLPFIQTRAEEIVSHLKQRSYSLYAEADDGFSPIRFDAYLQYRLRPQLGWYIDKIQNDYHVSRRERILALVVAGSGSVIVAISESLVALVAITTAAGIAITRRAEMRMYGATYSIYHDTALRLQNAMSAWGIRTDQDDPAARAAYIATIEGIFREEQDKWRDQAVQSLKATEEAIMNSLQRGINTYDAAAVEEADSAGTALPGA